MGSNGSSTFVLRWGIIATGNISGHFVRDLVLDPATRDVTDLAHAVVAVGSRSVEKAQAFIEKNCPQGGFAQACGLISQKPEAYGNYAEVYSNPNVDVIYIGTPHTSHFEDAKNALEAGKHVLVEKPAALNQAEFKHLSGLAKSKNLFLMEAVWTRFFPLTYALEEVLFKEQAIGEIRRLFSDFSIDFVDVVDESHRMQNINLAGGGLLDLGPYPMVWALLLLYRHPDNKHEAPLVDGSLMKHKKTGVDLHTNWTLDFPNIGLGVRATCSCSIASNTPKEAATRILGDKGEVIMGYPTARPTSFVIRRSKVGRGPQEYTEEVREFPINGQGLHWEADAVARYIRDGKTESERMPHSETLLELSIFDEVRRKGGYIFPEGLEKIDPVA